MSSIFRLGSLGGPANVDRIKGGLCMQHAGTALFTISCISSYVTIQVSFGLLACNGWIRQGCDMDYREVG
jgi:hypothetical protein